MIVLGLSADGRALPLTVDNSARLKVLLDAQTGNLNVSATNVTAGNVPLAVDAGARLKVLLDAQTSDIGVSVSNFVETTEVSVLSYLASGALAAGNSYHPDTAVPSGQFYRLTSLACTYNGVVAGVRLILYVVRSGGVVYLHEHFGLAAGRVNGWGGDIALTAGDAAGVLVIGATAGDTLGMHFCYRRVK